MMIAGTPIARAGAARGATWGATPEEALANLETVVKMVVANRRDRTVVGAEIAIQARLARLGDGGHP